MILGLFQFHDRHIIPNKSNISIPAIRLQYEIFGTQK
jgi:hypothetical protein